MTSTSAGSVIWVTPHGRDLVESRGWSTRPAQLVRGLAAGGVPVVVISRTRPTRTIRAWRSVAWRPALGAIFEASTPLPTGVRLLEHPAPAGTAERWQVRRAMRGLAVPIRAVVVSDPRSARILDRALQGLMVFDAYDAWDLSPLYRDRPRVVAAIREGYREAAQRADLVLTNTTFMADRLASLGARWIEILPNGCPEVDALAASGPDVVYVGNIQGRLRLDLLRAAADAAAHHGGRLRIVGGMQETPEGWAALLQHPAIDYRGPRFDAELTGELAGASVGIIPHRVDDYTCSQDAMKAWVYLAHGLAIVSTAVPPATVVRDIAAVADQPGAFQVAVSRAIANRAKLRPDRRRLASEHSWRRRADALIGLLG